MTIKCEFCNGLGKDEDANDCAWCWGTGSKAAQMRMTPPVEATAPDHVTTAQPAGQAQRHTIAHLRYAGGEEHNVKYVSEVDYDRVVAEREQLQRDLTARDEELDRLRTEQHQGEPVAMSAADFVARYCRESGISEADFYQSQVPMPDADSPYGWAAIANNPASIKAHVRIHMAAADPSAPECKTCNGTGMVDDGEITCSEGGIPYENGPVKCVKDCPDCAPVEIDERAEFEACFCRMLKEQEAGLPKYCVSTMRFGKEVMWEGWQARAALEHKS